MAGNIHVIKKDDVWQVKCDGSKKAIKNLDLEYTLTSNILLGELKCLRKII